MYTMSTNTYNLYPAEFYIKKDHNKVIEAWS